MIYFIVTDSHRKKLKKRHEKNDEKFSVSGNSSITDNQALYLETNGLDQLCQQTVPPIFTL